MLTNYQIDRKFSLLTRTCSILVLNQAKTQHHCYYFRFWNLFLLSDLLSNYIIMHSIWKWKWRSLSCVQLCGPMDCIVHGFLQARILEWAVFPFSRGSSQPRDWTKFFCIAGGLFTSWATREAQEYWSGSPIPSPADLPDPGSKPGSPALQVGSFTNWAIREAHYC